MLVSAEKCGPGSQHHLYEGSGKTREGEDNVVTARAKKGKKKGGKRARLGQRGLENEKRK